MTVRSLPPSEAVAQALQTLRQDGGVLQTSFFTYDADDEATGHAAIAKQALLARFAQMIAENAAFREGLPAGTRAFELRRTGEPTSEAISLDDLVGPAFDAVTGELRLFDFSPGYTGRSSNDRDTLARALLNPPYGLRIPGAREWPKSAEQERAYNVALGTALRRFVEGVVGISLLGLDRTPPSILDWSTEWTNFFDAGREWWGTFCWTVLRPTERVVVVLMASSTDLRRSRPRGGLS